MTDLLNKLKSTGSKASAEGTEIPVSQHDASGDNNLLKNVDSLKTNSAATEQSQSAGEKEPEKSATEKIESKGSEGFKDSESWTDESMLKEIKKLREENKAKRHKYELSLEQMKSSMESRMGDYKKDLDEAITAKKELDGLKAKEADKKRSLEEKLNHFNMFLQE